MTEAKIRLSMRVPGARLLSPQECKDNPEESFNVDNINIKYITKKGKRINEVLPVTTRKNCLVTQSLNITKEAYCYMTDKDCPPTSKLAKKVYIAKTSSKDKTKKPEKAKVESTVWAQMPLKKRLEWHMSRIAESLGAVKYQFEVLDD